MDRPLICRVLTENCRVNRKQAEKNEDEAIEQR